MTEKIDEKYTRVTEALYPFSGLGAVDKAVLENAARRGTKVHEICEKICAGEETYWMMTPEVQGYVDSFRKWWDKGHKIVKIEQRFYDDELLITGAVDLIVENDKGDGVEIIDIKTPLKQSPTWLLQGCAYAYMAKKHGYNVTAIKFLQVNKFGKEPKLYEYDYETGIDLYRCVLKVYNHFFKKKKRSDDDHKIDHAAE